MAKSVNVKAIPSNLAIGETPFYRLVVEGVGTVSKQEFVKRFATALRLPASEAQYTIDQFWATIESFLLEAKSINLEFMSIRLSIGGSVKSMTDQPTKDANPVTVNITIKGEAAANIAAIELKNVTVTIEAAIHEIMQIGASGVSRFESDQDFVINGKGLMLDAGAADEGVWLEKAGTIVKKAEVKSSDHSDVRGNFGSLEEVENGVYELCIATRDGKSAAEAPARILRRKVTVAK